MTESQLLQEYAQTGSQQAFAQLVQAHVHWVHSAALRQVRDPHLADDVTQAVFIALAKKAPSLRTTESLAPWLFQVTRYAAANALRGERRRRHHEQQAAMSNPSPSSSSSPDPDWEQISPLLDEAVAALGEPDRRAILLRFYENHTFPAIGQALGISEEAARKRTDRAIEELRSLFARRGVPIGSIALAGLLLTHASQHASAALLASVLRSSTVPSPSSPLLNRIPPSRHLRWLKLAAPPAAAILLAGIALRLALLLSAPAATSPAPATLASTRPAPETGLVAPDLNPLPPLRIRHTDRSDSGIHESETIYDPAKGVIIRDVYPLATYVSWDDGRDEWRFSPGANLIGRSPSRYAGQLKPMGQRVLTDWVSFQPVRLTDPDQVLVGVLCRCYELTGPGLPSGQFRVWADSANRLHRMQQSMLDESPPRTREDDITYNAVFTAADFPSTRPANGVVTVDLDRYLDRQFPLAGALYTRESAGLTFAVHECQRDEQGCFYLICSTRLTDQSREILPPVRLFDYYGGAGLTSAKAFAGTYTVAIIASLGASATSANYVILIPRSGAKADGNGCTLALKMQAFNALQEHLTRSNLPTSEEFVAEFPFQPQTPPPTLPQFVHRAYAQATTLGPLMNATLIHSDGRTGHASRPAEIPEPDYLRAIADDVEHLRHLPRP